MGSNPLGVTPEAERIVEQAARAYLKHTEPWLLALVLHGSALKGDFIPGCSDVDFQLYLRHEAFTPEGYLPFEIALAIHRDLAAIDLRPFGSIQGYAFPADRLREGWVGPVPGTYRVLAGTLPVQEARPDELLAGARRKLTTLDQELAYYSGGLLDHGAGRIQRHTRLLCTTVWPTLKSLLVLRAGNPVRPWTLTKEGAIAALPLPEDSDEGAAIRRFYTALRLYYPAQSSTEGALAIFEHGAAFLDAASRWWQVSAIK